MTVDLRAFPELLACHMFQNITLPCHLQADKHLVASMPAYPCHSCPGHCTRKGTRNGVQLLRCGACGRYQRASYVNNACAPGADKRIALYTKEGCGIRSIARIMAISPTTVIARTRSIAARLGPGIVAKGRSYEVDELSTYTGNKKNRVWLAYALDRKSKQVVGIRVGKRSKRMLRPLIETLLLADAKRIRTDGCDVYRSLIPEGMHAVKRFGTNSIERMNLTLRTRLKRLGRRTICYTKSLAMLWACAAIACWG